MAPESAKGDVHLASRNRLPQECAHGSSIQRFALGRKSNVDRLRVGEAALPREAEQPDVGLRRRLRSGYGLPRGRGGSYGLPRGRFSTLQREARRPSRGKHGAEGRS
jgi:hypothetical protein